mgnify:CR=1 FL=1
MRSKVKRMRRTTINLKVGKIKMENPTLKEMIRPKMIKTKDPTISLMMFNCRQNNRKMMTMKMCKMKKFKVRKMTKIMYKMNPLKKNNSVTMTTKIIKKDLNQNKINKSQNRLSK